jgi:hypothetical protein
MPYLILVEIPEPSRVARFFLFDPQGPHDPSRPIDLDGPEEGFLPDLGDEGRDDGLG